jgi:hypothetical protein
LDVAERDAGVEGGSDERVPERVRTDGLGDPGPFRDSAEGAAGAVPIEPLPAGAQQDRPVKAFADGQVEAPGGPWCERDGDDLPALQDCAKG